MAAEAIDPFPNYSKTQRIVLLIDLNPLLHLQDPNPYLKTLISSSKTLLSFPPLSSSLFSFKPFFSSLSPLLSSSKLPFPSSSLSFNHSDSTLHSLTHFVTSLPTIINKASFPLYPSRALNLAASLRQLVHEYAWDPLIPDPVVGATSNSGNSVLIRSNLVILLSPVHRDLNWVREFFDVEVDHECLNDLGSFVKQFSGVFGSVNDALVSRDIHCCWVDLKFQPWENGDLENLGFKCLGNGIRSLGWGFCSSDSIVLGSAIVPFGLIYPNIAVSSNTSPTFEFNDDSDKKDDSGEFYADRVLQILARDMGEPLARKPVGIWLIFLSFLHREGYWALVSLSDGDSNLHTGILKPFTVFSAMICITGDGFCPNKFLDSSKVDSAAAKRDDENLRLHVDSKHALVFSDSQSQSSPSHKFAGKRKNKIKSPLPHDLTWSAFCQAAVEHLEIDLEACYFSRACKLKKLKFLKCWMKQVQKRGHVSFKIQERTKPDQDAKEEINHRPIELPQDIEQLASYSVSAGEGCLRVLDDAGNDFCSGTLENFFDSLPNKIKQGLESGEVELGAFAERLVRSSIYWLCQKHEIEGISESQTSLVQTSDACASKAAVELIELLLREPKDLAAVHKRRDQSSQASDSRSTESASANVVREYELQILFRMEILQSEVGAIIEEPMKQKFVKQICSLLESIQCHLDGGFFGDWRLDKYVEKIIKSRYYLSLGDVVDRIYRKMDLLLFDDEDELPNHLLNSEDSNRSWKEKPEEDVHSRNHEPVSIEEESPQLQKYDNKRILQVMRTEEHELKLIQAQEMRERARRFSSFTSWMPDLQRVWAPKQPKAMKSKSDNLRKLSKRKSRSKASYDMVCETPMTEKKRSSTCRTTTDDKDDCGDCRAHPHGPVSKALFQDDM
ncbi:hypothetical protein Golob_015703 [Gossypium lobatum]|uniref:Treslin N-terminal domain-containing protein n=1 Tax=Gossypium lobatum TaxID=34289 RepID=A0A7J8M1Z0_9ROSI|nr:hypothetical protein [Gossypium lobatum]